MFKRIKLFNHYLIIGFKKTYHAHGITSICKDNKHVIFWDFDKVRSINKDLIPHLRKIQKQHNLSNIYLFRSSPNKYHAYCLKKHDFFDMFHIIRFDPFIGEVFLMHTGSRNEATLRMSVKNNHRVKFLTCIPGKGKGEGSSAHREYLAKLIPQSQKYFKQENLTWDKIYRLMFVEYDSGEQK